MKKTKVLLVEDDLNWLKIFHTLIGPSTDEFFEYVHVPDLASAVAAISTGDFGLILLDLMLPDSQALHTIQVVSGVAKPTPIIVLTTLDDTTIMSEGFKLGIEDYLVKDQYDVKTLVQVARRAINRATTQIEIAVNEDLKKLLANLRSLDKSLAEWQKASDENIRHMA